MTKRSRARMRLRSMNSDVEAHVQFVNRTSRRINVYWIDYQGRGRLQFTMKPNDTCNRTTYLTHPWFFRDRSSGELMQVAHLNVFLPQLYTIPDPQNLRRRIPCRRQIVIHFPVYTLRIACLHKTASAIQGSENIDHDVASLEIPRTLQFDLKYITNRYRQWQSTDNDNL